MREDIGDLFEELDKLEDMFESYKRKHNKFKWDTEVSIGPPHKVKIKHNKNKDGKFILYT